MTTGSCDSMQAGGPHHDRSPVEPCEQTTVMGAFTVGLAAWTVLTSLIALLLPGTAHSVWHTLVIVAPMGLVPASWFWAHRRYARFAATMRSLDLSAILAVQGMRIAGLAMLALWSVHELAPLFAAWTGILDVFIGLTAVPLAYLATRVRPLPRRLLRTWSVIGLLDFIVALPIAFLSLNGSPAHSVVTMFSFPMSFLPMAGVPFMIVMHLTVLLQTAPGSRIRAGDLIHRNPAVRSTAPESGCP